MSKMTEIRVLVLIDEEGEWVIGKDDDELHERYTEAVGEDTAAARRVVAITLKVPLPTVVELNGEVPAEPTINGLTVK
jgi:hypothetical protein